MLVQVLREVYARRDETCKRLLEEVPGKDEGRGDREGRESLHGAARVWQRLRSVRKTLRPQRHSERLGKANGALTRRPPTKKPEEGVAPVRKPCSVRAGSSPRSAELAPERAESGQWANHAPCRRRRRHRVHSARERARTVSPSPSFSWEPDSPQIVRHSTAPGQDIRSTLWRARSPVFIFQGGNIFVTERRLNLWGLTYPKSDEGFWGKLWPMTSGFFVCLFTLTMCRNYRPWNLQLSICCFVLLFLPWPERLWALSTMAFFHLLSITAYRDAFFGRAVTSAPGLTRWWP